MPRTWQAGDPWEPRNPENKDRTRRLQGELRARLLTWDPLGVADAPECQDEYDCLISPLLHRLHDGASERQLAAWIRSELRNHFGMSVNRRRERRLAGDLVQWWRQTVAGQ